MWAEGTRAALLYSAVTLALAYPLSRHPASLVLPQGADTNLLIWLLKWDVHALVHQPLSIFDANIFYPFRHTLAYAENLIGSALLAAPFIWLGNSILALNVVELLSCALCGIGAFVLARRVGATPPAATLAGLIFAFAPPHFFRLGQLHLVAIQWVPFCLASMHAYLQSGRRQDLRWACAFFCLQTLTSGHGAVFVALALVVLIVWRVALGEPVRAATRLRDLGVPGAMLLALAALTFLPYRAVQLEMGLKRGLGESYLFSPNAVSFITSPTYVDRFVLSRFVDPSSLGEAMAYLFPGYLTVVLAIGGVWAGASRRRDVDSGSLAKDFARRLQHFREKHRNNAASFYTLLGILSLWLSLGPLWGLYGLVYAWPGISFIRVPSRFTLLGLLCLAVLAALGFDRWTSRTGSARRELLGALVGAALVVEFFAAPLNAIPYAVDIPQIDRWLTTQPKPFVVAEFPVADPPDTPQADERQSEYMIHSMAHWERTIHGWSGMEPPLHRQLFSELVDFPDESVLGSLASLGVTRVVVHSDLYPSAEWPKIESRLEGSSEWLTLLHTAGMGHVYSLHRPPLDVMLRQRHEHLAAAMAKQDPTSCARFYVDAAAVLSPDLSVASGRSQVEEWLRRVLGDHGSHFKVDEASEVTMGSGEAYVTGTFTADRTPDRTETRRGNYVEVWTFSGGQWMVVYQVFGALS